MNRKILNAGMIGLMGCAVMVSPYALAEDYSFWYGGLNVGLGGARIDDARITSELAASGLTAGPIQNDDTDMAYKLFGGYQFNQYLAVEGGYFDLGRFGYSTTTVPVGTLAGNVRLKGLNLDLVGLWPITEKFSAFGRIGANYAQADDNFTSTGAVSLPANASPGENGTSYKAGLGLQYDVSRSLALRAEGERYRVKDGLGNDGDINLMSLGLVYRFGRDAPAPVRPAPVPKAAAKTSSMPGWLPIMVVVPVSVKAQQYCSILDVEFEIKQDEIQPEDREKMAVVGTFMKKYPDTTAVIEGHSDNVGTSEFNMKLSQRRADSVVDYLVNDLKIASSRLSAVGYGETRPIADNSTPEGQRANRRIGAVIACVTDVAGLKVLPARLTMALEIEFDPYMSNVDPQYFGELNEVAKFMRANPAANAIVEAHSSKYLGEGADKIKVDPAVAMKVSELRAKKVVDYLADKQGVSRSRLSTTAFGQASRASYGTTLEGQQENRRINVIYTYPK
ncbi:MAG: OmpA family protein [Sideroxyarcus sp.]|nr:OmpA family protein [Sideroxyarcus sp.]